MFTRISTYLNQRSLSATLLAAALTLWYAASTTILPAAIQMSALPAAQAEAPAQPEAKPVSMCTGMACSIESKNGGGCCCTAQAEESSGDDKDAPAALTLTKDCDSLGGLTLSVTRNIPSTPARVANLVFAPEFETVAVAAIDSELLPAHTEDIEHVPILLFV